MSTVVTVYVLTALAAVVVVLTGLRRGGASAGAGRLRIGGTLFNLHTGIGVLALITWLLFLVADPDTVLGGSVVGIVGLTLWWVEAIIGLLILVRWLPSRGRHASTGTKDSWWQGPVLSVLAHVGLFVSVCVFTWAYLLPDF